jgi:3-deoxy-D-glycero-D-galacto-nononate 9-phosphate synthase
MKSRGRDEIYIIGEIGQNHNGSVDLAKLLIDMIARKIEESYFDLMLKGMNAVKLTKRDLDEELSPSEMNRPYDSPNSFGETYGEHRKALELNDEQHFEIYKHAKSYNLDFIETLCAKGCLSMLKLFTPDYLKVASRDLTNLPLLSALAETKIPVIISTGMADKKDLDDALNTISRYHDDISILHCVSEYPTHPAHVNFKTISYLIENYSEYTIGFSDHTIGISAPVAAAAMGARVIEKHITLDRRMKGSDQAGSLGPDGVNRMIRDLRLLEMGLGKKELFMENGVLETKMKLERSIAVKREVKSGEVLAEEDLFLISPGTGYRWRERDKLIGKKVLKNIPEGEIITENLLSES